MNLVPGQGPTGPPSAPPRIAAVVRRTVDAETSARATRAHWDLDAAPYLVEHGSVLGESDLVWGPEGLREAEVRLLGDVNGRRILDLGCGAGQCARWLTGEGALAVGVDLSAGMLQQALLLDATHGSRTPLVQGDGRRLPFRDEVFDAVMSSFGVLPFVSDADAVLDEVFRVLKPSGRFALSLVHPFRWVFPDSPHADDLNVQESYFDRRPYVEEDATGSPVYVEHHRTMGDLVRLVRGAGLVLDDLIEPQWSRSDPSPWGAWSPERSAMVPGTAILVGHRPPDARDEQSSVTGG